MKHYDINNEIQKYYKISIFVNRYIFFLWSLILSFILILIFNIKNSNILVYANSDILTKTLNNENIVVWESIDEFNKTSKYIKSDFILKNSNLTDYKNSLYTTLWIWIFKDKYNIYYPMNLKIENTMFQKLNTQEDTKEDILNTYLNILKKSDKKQDITFIKPKIVTKEDNDVIKEYNLWCMNTYLNNSIFCNKNKNNLINDLINERTFDISSNFYDKLFLQLPWNEEKKCNILTQIYNNKYNFNNIQKLLEENNCYVELFQQSDEFITEVIQDDQNLFKVWDKLPKYYDVLMQKLIQQFYIIVVQDDVPDYMIYNNIKLLKKMIENDQMDSTIAILAKNVLNDLIKKDSFNKKTTKSSLEKIINELRKWNDYEKWLDHYIESKYITWNNSSIIINIENIKSEREKVMEIFNKKYKNIFTITKDIIYDDKTKIVSIEWDIYLVFEFQWSQKTIPLKISFDIKNIIWTKFDIYNLNFIDEKIQNYVKENNFNINHSSLVDLKQQLEDKLYAPLINNDYWENTLSICDKFKQINKNANCNNDKVLISIKDTNISPSLNIIFTLNNDLNIKNIEISSYKIKYKLDNLLNETIDIDLSSLIKKINYISNKNWYNYSKIWYIQNIIESNIKKQIKQNELKLVWLSNQEIISLNNKFKEFLWTDIELIRQFKWYYRLFFTLKSDSFWILYDKSKNNIKWISIYIPKKLKNFLFMDIDITLASLNQEQLNSFKTDPLNFLKQKNIKIYNDYITFINNNR